MTAYENSYYHSGAGYMLPDETEQWTEKDYMFWLLTTPGIYRRQFQALMKYFGSAERVFHSEQKDWDLFARAGLSWAEHVKRRRKFHCAEEAHQRLRACRASFVCLGEDTYPERLKQIADPPYGLFFRGNLPQPDTFTVSVVGARACSTYGSTMAEKIGSAIAGSGIQLVSGLALGIDGIAQRAAYDSGGLSYGVLGSGVDICYPKEHLKLFRDLAQGGGIVSEYPCGSQPKGFHFPMRNRIISGLSDAVIVIEARKKSGSLITAEEALEQGREVYALPGRSCDALSEGCNALIAGGAGIIRDIDSLMESLLELADNHRLGLMRRPDGQTGSGKRDTGSAGNRTQLLKSGLAPEEERVYSFLDLSPIDADTLLLSTDMSPEALQRILTGLEIRGLVRRMGPNQYRKMI